MAIKPRYLRTLAVNDHFETRDEIAGVQRGIVARVPAGPDPGYVQVRVERSAYTRKIIGGATEQIAARYALVEWSPNTRVFKVQGVRTMTEDYDTDNDGGDASGVSISRMLKSSGLNGELRDPSKGRLIPMAKVQKKEEKKALPARLQALKDKQKAAGKDKVAKTPVKANRSPKAPEKPCLCGCGELAKRNFKQGHDGRYYGYLRRVVNGTEKFEDLNITIRKALLTPQGVKKALAEHDVVRAKNKAERD